MVQTKRKANRKAKKVRFDRNPIDISNKVGPGQPTGTELSDMFLQEMRGAQQSFFRHRSQHKGKGTNEEDGNVIEEGINDDDDEEDDGEFRLFDNDPGARANMNRMVDYFLENVYDDEFDEPENEPPRKRARFERGVRYKLVQDPFACSSKSGIDPTAVEQSTAPVSRVSSSANASSSSQRAIAPEVLKPSTAPVSRVSRVYRSAKASSSSQQALAPEVLKPSTAPVSQVSSSAKAFSSSQRALAPEALEPSTAPVSKVSCSAKASSSSLRAIAPETSEPSTTPASNLSKPPIAPEALDPSSTPAASPSKPAIAPETVVQSGASEEPPSKTRSGRIRQKSSAPVSRVTKPRKSKSKTSGPKGSPAVEKPTGAPESGSEPKVPLKRARGRPPKTAKKGVAKNGVAKSGVAKSGVAKNGVAKNGVAKNGVAKKEAAIVSKETVSRDVAGEVHSSNVISGGFLDEDEASDI